MNNCQRSDKKSEVNNYFLVSLRNTSIKSKNKNAMTNNSKIFDNGIHYRRAKKLPAKFFEKGS